MSGRAYFLRNVDLILGGVLLIAVFFSGFFLVDATNQMRKHNYVMSNLQKEYDSQLEEYSSLRLEHGALTSLQRIEEIAVSRLAMIFPKEIDGILQ